MYCFVDLLGKERAREEDRGEDRVFMWLMVVVVVVVLVVRVRVRVREWSKRVRIC